jgi:hypothetical protein
MRLRNVDALGIYQEHHKYLSAKMTALMGFEPHLVFMSQRCTGMTRGFANYFPFIEELHHFMLRACT